VGTPLKTPFSNSNARFALVGTPKVARTYEQSVSFDVHEPELAYASSVSKFPEIDAASNLRIQARR
jgi:hypothetical protein